MSCLLCLRSEGIYFQKEPIIDLQILVNLFSIKKEFSQVLKGYKCCSVCRVKLQFVEVINEEISILNEKLKHFEDEVKQVFVSSFQENGESKIEDQFSARARRELLNELNLTQSDEEYESEIPSIKIEQPDDSHYELNSDLISESTDSNLHYDSQDLQLRLQIMENESNEYNFSQMNLQPSSSQFPQSQLSQLLNSTPIEFPSTSSFLQVQVKPELKRKRHRNPNPSSSLEGRTYKMRIYTCTMCKTKQDFEQNDEYEEHLKTVHPTRPYSKCPTCTRILLEEQIGSESKLKQHMKMHSGLRPFKCEKCECSFKTRNHLKIHQETHLNRELFICDICEVTKTGLRNFNNHLRKQHGKNFYNCAYCGAISRKVNAPGYEEHLKTCRKNYKRRRSCN